MDDLYTKKFIRKPFFGIRFVSAGDEKANYLHNPLPSGLYISQVFPSGVCARAGIQAGDMLYKLNEFPLDAYGETDVSWLPNKISIYDIISRIKVGDEISMVIYRNGERKDIKYIIDDVIPFAIRRRFPDYEDVSYDTIAGMVIMELAENHLSLLLDDAPELIRFRQPEERINPVLIITNIVPGSYAYEVESLAPGNIIIAVNGMPVTTLDEWKKALEKSVETGFIVLMTEHDVLTVFSLKKVLDDEEKLSKAFEYPLSENVKNLQKLFLKSSR